MFMLAEVSQWLLWLYWVMAIVGTVVFVMKIVLMLAGADHHGDMDGDVDVDIDHDLDGHIDIEHADSAMSFKLLTVQSFFAFFMACGWLGVAMGYGVPGVHEMVNVVASIIFGFAMMFMSAFLMTQMRKLAHAGSYDVNTTVGQVGKVYMRIPEKGKGTGQVQLTVNGRKQMVNAVSTGPEIDAFADVTIVQIDGGHTLVVEPAG